MRPFSVEGFYRGCVSSVNEVTDYALDFCLGKVCVADFVVEYADFDDNLAILEILGKNENVSFRTERYFASVAVAKKDFGLAVFLVDFARKR